MTQMTHEQILDTIGDASISHAVYSRRDLLSRSTMGVAALALAGMPIGLATVTERALAQNGTAAPTAALTLALKLELLERQFYTNGLAAAGTLGFTADEAAAVTAILAHETAHVALLSAIVPGVTAPVYDFTGGSGTGAGPFAPFTSHNDFFALAQLLEDAGVRAYKGQLPSLMGDAHLTTAMKIHSVEARHATQIRLLRGATVTPPSAQTLNSFAQGFSSTQAPLAIAVYGPTLAPHDSFGKVLHSEGEDNVVITSSYAPNGWSTGDARIFDEPLSAAHVLAIGAFFNVV